MTDPVTEPVQRDEAVASPHGAEMPGADHDPHGSADSPAGSKDRFIVKNRSKPDTEASPARLESPVAEARKYRKRAQAAEQAAADLKRELDDSQKALREREETITSLERRQRIDELLRESECVDLSTARLLTEISVGAMDEPDVQAAVDELRRSKPFLFPSAGRARRAVAQSPRTREGAEASSRQAEHAATDAQESGRRADLLRYLRLRRRAG